MLWLPVAGIVAAQGSFGQYPRVEDSMERAGVSLDLIAPRIAKRYVPPRLYGAYPWQSWEYTNHAEQALRTGQRYRRYVDYNLWGDFFYDYFGNPASRGWLVYSWTEEHPRISESSVIWKQGLSSLVLASDTSGGNAFSITLGDEIFTTLTPLTFRKTVYNGVQVDYSADRLELTGLFSRISAPGLSVGGLNGFHQVQEYTNLVGGRAAFSMTQAVTVGAVLVSARNGRGTLETLEGNPFKGELTSHQLEKGIHLIVIRVSDDSPADGEGGATLLLDDVEIFTRIADRDTVLLGSRIGLVPERCGGVLREGARTADGSDQITLTYDLERLQAVLDDRDAINQVRDLRFRLTLVNDYRVDVTSNQQTNADEQPVYLLVARAPGNVPDDSNKREVVFSYGVPTATRVMGVTLEARDVLGFNLYSELDINHNFRKFPNKRYGTHKAHAGVRGDESAAAWMVNLSRSWYPWYVFGEAFHIDEDYNTSPFIVDGVGRVDYADSTQSLYDFVDDNDDQDRKPDQNRMYQDPRTAQELGAEGRQQRGFADEAVLPGWDQNRDFISDFNQNSNFYIQNLYPDYEEPFLRYATDRPEYLFGIDLNNNGWVDQFENDDEPDYPYKRDHRGYNVYVRNRPVPGLQVTVGRSQERLIADDREATTNYVLGAYERDWPGRGRVRVYHMIKKVRDDIPDDLVQWIQEPGQQGGHTQVTDPLFAQDAWVSSFWCGFDRHAEWGTSFAHKLKWELVRQGDRGGRNTRFLGLINKVDYLFTLGRVSIRPKFKSEILTDDTPYSMGGVIDERQEWTRLLYLTASMPALTRTTLELGLEQMLFSDFLVAEDELKRGDFTRDVRSLAVAAQLQNHSDYLGYGLTTYLGYSLRRISRQRSDMGDKTDTESMVFVTVYAGLREW